MEEKAKKFGKSLDIESRKLIFSKIAGGQNTSLVGIQEFYSFIVNYKISNNQNDAIFLFKKLLNNKHSKTLSQEDFFSYFGCQLIESIKSNRLIEVNTNQLTQHSYGMGEYLQEGKSSQKQAFKKNQEASIQQKENTAPNRSSSQNLKASPANKQQGKSRKVQSKESPNFNIISFDKDFQCVTLPTGQRSNIQETADTNYLSEDPFFTEGLISNSDYGSKQRQTSEKEQQAILHKNFISIKSSNKAVSFASNKDEDIDYLRLSKVDTPFSSNKIQESRDLTPDLEQAMKRRQDRARSRTPVTYIENKKRSQDNPSTDVFAARYGQRSPSITKIDIRHPSGEYKTSSDNHSKINHPTHTATHQQAVDRKRVRDKSPASPMYTSTPSGQKQRAPQPSDEPRSRDNSTNYKFERVDSTKTSATKRSSTPIINLKYDRERNQPNKYFKTNHTSPNPSPFKSSIPKKGRTISQQTILELMLLEAKLESYKIALSHSKDFNISHLFESIDNELNGFITKSQLFKLLESLSIEVDRKVFEDFFLHIIDKRPRITFINFSKLFYPVSSIQFEVMRKKMYSYASCPDYQMSPVTKSALSTFFQLHLSFSSIKESAREHYKTGDFLQFLKELTNKNKQQLELKDLENDYEMSAFPDDIKKKVFETLDRNYNSKVCEEDFLHFLDL